jgi:hypothetical protein
VLSIWGEKSVKKLAPAYKKKKKKKLNKIIKLNKKATGHSSSFVKITFFRLFIFFVKNVLFV